MARIVFIKNVENEYLDHFLNKNDQAVHYSDFSANYKKLLRFLLYSKADELVFLVSNVNRIRWRFLYTLLLCLNPTANKYYQDSNRKVCINYIFLSKETIAVLFSILIQLSSFIIYPVLVFLSLIPRKINTSTNINNILFLRTNQTFDLKAGGSLGHIIGIIEGFIKNSKKVLFIGADDIPGLPLICRKYIIPPFSSVLSFPLFSNFYYSIHFLIKAIRIPNKKNSLIYYRINYFDLSPVLIRLFCGVPLIVEFNSFLNWENNRNNFRNPLITIANLIEKIVLIRADLIVCVSDNLKIDLLSKGYKKEKIIVCYNGVNTEKFCSFNSPPPNYINNKINICFSGTFGHWHGIDLLTESILNLPEYIHKKIHFSLIGDGLLKSRAMNQLSNLKNVTFLGLIPYNEITKHLNHANIYLCSHKLQNGENKFIGSPTKMFEYMSMGKIIIATNLDQIATVLDPSLSLNDLKSKNLNKNAVAIVTNPNSYDFSDAIINCVNMLTDLEYLGNNARHKVSNNFTWENVTSSILFKLSE